MMDQKELTFQVKQKAIELGFQLVGVTTPDPPPHLDFFREWCKAGNHGSMDWIATPRSIKRRSNPREILPNCESILVLGSPYPIPKGNVKGGNIASYALNQDYHDVLGKCLRQLVESVQEWVGESVPSRCYVDTGPVLERDLAMRAGLGWIGKNTTLINKDYGSYFFLAEILLGIELVTDMPHSDSFCGSCTSCLEVCPTGALVEPYTLDANRCISYLTIEHREAIPDQLRPLMGDWIFGCDICQMVCPWNKPGDEPPGILEELQPRAELLNINLAQEMSLNQEEFKTRYRGSPIKRAKRRGYLRNVAIALGNLGSEDVVPVLGAVLGDEEPLVRVHAVWALGQIGGKFARHTLETFLLREEDPVVKKEIISALDALSSVNS